MDLMTFLAQHATESVNARCGEMDIWDQFGVEIAPLVIDSVGFTRTTQAEGIVHFLTQLAVARDITNQVLRESDPISFVFHADNCFAFFGSADAALQAGIEVRSAINGAALPLTGGENFGLSMGIGFGTLLAAGGKDGYFGDEMNIASKLGEDIGGRDDIFLSEAAYLALNKKDGFSFEEMLGTVSGATFSYYKASEAG